MEFERGLAMVSDRPSISRHNRDVVGILVFNDLATRDQNKIGSNWAHSWELSTKGELFAYLLPARILIFFMHHQGRGLQHLY